MYAMHDIIITVPDPDRPEDMPIYEGPVSDAWTKLAGGEYTAESFDVDAVKFYGVGRLIVWDFVGSVLIDKGTGQVYGNGSFIPEYTADHVLITDGLRVFDNNIDVVTVDLTGARAELNGDIWFDTKRLDGTRSHLMNGERIATYFQGRKA